MGRRRTDADLLMASSASPSAFGELFDRHFDAIFSFLRRRVGAERAEDLAAQTFELAFRSRSRYDRARHDARPWLYGIATNLLREHRRHERRRLLAYGRVPFEWAQADEVDAIVSRADSETMAARAARALASLRPDERDVLLLVVWGQLSYQEIAAALDVPIGTVRSRLSRARKKIRELIEASGPYRDERNVIRASRKERTRG
jgi:RNA polymerase sigma-70 factor (ECF subfamily)